MARAEGAALRGPWRATGAALVAAALLVALAGCANEGITRGGTVLSDTLTVYSLLPDPRAPAAADMVAGEKLALAQAGGRAGRFTINFSSVAEGPGTEAAEVADATRDVISDTQVIAVIGGLDTAGTRTTAPLFNEAGILQVALGAGYPGFTRRVAADEPARYQPAARPTLARMVGDDDQQAPALVAAAGDPATRTVQVGDALERRLRGRAIAVEQEGGADAAALAGAVTVLARRAGARIVEDPRRADALIYAGGDPVTAAGVADRPGGARTRVVLPDAVVRAGVARRLSAAARRRAVLVSSAPAPASSPAQRRFEADFRRAMSRAPGPYAAVGYEAMRSVLEALRRAGDRANQRQRVIDAFLGAPARASLLGPLQVDRAGLRVAPRFTIERARG